jgi:hypothetical protein
MSMLSLLLVVDMVVDRCGRWPILEVRGTAEGCREEAEGSRMGKPMLLSVGLAIVSSATGGCGTGTSPRLGTRLSSERVIVDLDRLCWLPLLLLGGELVDDWMEAYEGCLCRCGLGDGRDDMERDICRAWSGHRRGGAIMVIGWRDGDHLLTIMPLSFVPLSLIYKAELDMGPWALQGVLCCQGVRAQGTYLSSCEAMIIDDPISGRLVFVEFVFNEHLAMRLKDLLVM